VRSGLILYETKSSIFNVKSFDSCLLESTCTASTSIAKIGGFLISEITGSGGAIGAAGGGGGGGGVRYFIDTPNDN
jgi:hypothetical protein